MKKIEEDNAMTQSVEELRRRSERSRAELETTLGQLTVRITDTAEDIRHKASPQHVKSEVSSFISTTTRGWVEGLKQQAIENPMQAIAAGSAIAVPVLRLARRFPLPLLMIGAGLALTSKTVRKTAFEAAASTWETAGDTVANAAERAQSLRSAVENVVSQVRDKAVDTANNAQDAAGGLADDVRNQAAQASTTISDKIKGGFDTAKQKLERARSTVRETAGAARDAAATAPAKAGEVIGDNAAMISGLGIAIGALIAAALPETKAEAKFMGPASDSAKQAAGEAAQSGLEVAKDAARSVAGAAAKSVTNADLSGHASRMTKNVADTLKEAADDVVAAAFNPSPKPEHLKDPS